MNAALNGRKRAINVTQHPEQYFRANCAQLDVEYAVESAEDIDAAFNGSADQLRS